MYPQQAQNQAPQQYQGQSQQYQIPPAGQQYPGQQQPPQSYNPNQYQRQPAQPQQFAGTAQSNLQPQYPQGYPAAPSQQYPGQPQPGAPYNPQSYPQQTPQSYSGQQQDPRTGLPIAGAPVDSRTRAPVDPRTQQIPQSQPVDPRTQSIPQTPPASQGNPLQGAPFQGYPQQQTSDRNPAQQPRDPRDPADQYPGQAPPQMQQAIPQYPGAPSQQYPGALSQQYPGAPTQQYPGAPTQQYPGAPTQQYQGQPIQQTPGQYPMSQQPARQSYLGQPMQIQANPSSMNIYSGAAEIPQQKQVQQQNRNVLLGTVMERQVASLFVAMEKNESQIEAARQRLCANPNFNLDAAYQKINYDGNGNISHDELVKFLRQNNCFTVSESESYQLIDYFDADNNNRMTFDEFVQMLLPCEDNELRNETQDRQPYRLNLNEPLNQDVANGITFIIEKEVSFAREIEQLKRDFLNQPGYSYQQSYNSVDKKATGGIDSVSLGVYLRSLGHPFNDMELLAIIRRIDTNGDATITFEEWYEFLQLQKPIQMPALQQQNTAYAKNVAAPLRSKAGQPLKGFLQDNVDRQEPAQQDQQIQNQPNFGQNRPGQIQRISSQPKKQAPVQELNDPRQYQPQAVKSRPPQLDDVDRSKPVNVQQADKKVRKSESLERRRDQLPQPVEQKKKKSKMKADVSPERQGGRMSPRKTKKIGLRQEEQEQLCKILKEFCDLEDQLENQKISLIQRQDFNIYDAFNFFDLNRNNYVTIDEIISAIQGMNITTNVKEVALLVDRYDKSGDFRLSFEEFSEAFLPLDATFADILLKRSTNYLPNQVEQEVVFSQDTMSEFENLLQQHITSEFASQAFRETLNENSQFNVFDAFTYLDVNFDKNLKASELKEILESNGHIVSDKQVQLLIDKFDESKDGMVSFQEFNDEIRNRTLPIDDDQYLQQ